MKNTKQRLNQTGFIPKNSKKLKKEEEKNN